MDIITKYFEDLSETQLTRFAALQGLYAEWNDKINVISRKDLENLYEKHILHSLAIARFISFRDQTKVLDLGTGGGLPGIPLAIFFPMVRFTLIDGIGKKVKVAEDIARQLGLENVTTIHGRAEELKTQYDFVVTRAVADLTSLLNWTRKLISPKHKNAWPNGIIALKGGDLKEEIKALPKNIYVDRSPLNKWFDEPFFEEKQIIYMQP